VEPTCRLQPTVRGVPGLSVLVLLTTSALEPLFMALVQRAGTEAYPVLQRFVRRLLGRGEDAAASGKAPTSVVFESAATGAQFVFTPGLPEEAFRQAVELDPGAEPGRWTWDAAARRWVCFEKRQRA
jgi:hypothetical protein